MLTKKESFETKQDINKYFIPNTDASRIGKDGNRYLLPRNSKERIEMAKQQYNKQPTKISKIIYLVNEFLDIVSNNSLYKMPKVDIIILDEKHHTIIDRAIIVHESKWKDCYFDKNERRYTYWDEKYDEIKKVFKLRYANDIVWIKFTEDGYLGVVADSFDINYSYENTSGTLIRAIDKDKKWDSSFVIIFPITEDLLVNRTRKEIETGIGNYLEGNGVPIIDYFSHNNFRKY